MNADALAFLAGKGLSIEEIVEFARISERKVDRTNAERQARYREKGKAKKDAKATRYSNGVTPPMFTALMAVSRRFTMIWARRLRTP